MRDALPEAVRDRVDRLFQLQLKEFVAFRNRLSKDFKSDGYQEHAAWVSSLKRPGLSAWAINQAYWFERDTFQNLLDAGEELRSEQRRALAGRPSSQMREASVKRQARLREVLDRCASVLRESGHAAALSTLKTLQTSLEAILALGPAKLPEPLGWMTRDVEPPGFDALAGIAVADGSDRIGKSAAPDKRAGRREVERLQNQVRQLEQKQGENKEGVEGATRKRNEVQRRATECEQEVERLESRLRVARQQLRFLQAELRAVRDEEEAARKVLQQTQSVLSDAKRKLDSLKKSMGSEQT